MPWTQFVPQTLRRTPRYGSCRPWRLWGEDRHVPSPCWRPNFVAWQGGRIPTPGRLPRALLHLLEQRRLLEQQQRAVGIDEVASLKRPRRAYAETPAVSSRRLTEDVLRAQPATFTTDTQLI